MKASSSELPTLEAEARRRGGRRRRGGGLRAVGFTRRAGAGSGRSRSISRRGGFRGIRIGRAGGKTAGEDEAPRESGF